MQQSNDHDGKHKKYPELLLNDAPVYALLTIQSSLNAVKWLI